MSFSSFEASSLTSFAAPERIQARAISLHADGDERRTSENPDRSSVRDPKRGDRSQCSGAEQQKNLASVSAPAVLMRTASKQADRDASGAACVAYSVRALRHVRQTRRAAQRSRSRSLPRIAYCSSRGRTVRRGFQWGPRMHSLVYGTFRITVGCCQFNFGLTRKIAKCAPFNEKLREATLEDA